MLRHLIILPILALAIAAMRATTSVELHLHFDKDKSQLSPQAMALLDRLLTTIEPCGDHSLTLRGHTDSHGDHAYNEALSRARAEAVREHLLLCGFDPRTVSIAHLGEREPVASNDHAQGMGLNRRVEVIFIRHLYTDTDELRALLMEGSVQRFVIDPTRDQTIVGAAGARVRFPAGALVDAHGLPATGPVGVELTEALGLRAMLAHQLATRSGERLLETGGMLRVLANDAQGRPLRLAAESPIELAVPALDGRPGMELFLSDDGGDWSATAQPLVVTTVRTWQEPPRPARPNLDLRLPRYVVDQHDKPMKPVGPTQPRPPVAPREESYRAHVPWYRAHQRKALTAAAAQCYQDALNRHAEQWRKHEERMRAYEAELADLPAREQRYMERMEVWDRQKAEERQRWLNKVCEPALQRHRARNNELW
jgi:hypothetical protein